MERLDRLEARLDQLGLMRRLFAGGLKREVADARAAAETAGERHGGAISALLEAEWLPYNALRAASEARVNAGQQRDLVAAADACDTAAKLLDMAGAAAVASPRAVDAALGGNLAGAVAEATGRAVGRGGGYGGGGGAPSSPAPGGDDCGFAVLNCGSDDPQAQIRALQSFLRQWANAWELRMKRLANSNRPTVSAGLLPDPACWERRAP